MRKRGEIERLEPRRVQQRVEQRIHAADEEELVLLELGDEGREVARVGDQHVFRPEPHEQQAVRGQREDVIERQRGDHHARGGGSSAGRIQALAWSTFATMFRWVRTAALATPVVPPVYCRNAMSCGPTSTAASFRPSPEAKHALERRCARHVPGGDLLAYVTQHEVHDHSARKAQKIADAGHQHVLEARPRQHLLQDVGEILQDDDDLGAGVLELMLELAGGVERIDVHDHHARPQDAEQGDGILQDVRHHQGDPVAMRQPGFLLQPRRERPAEGVELCVAQGRAEAPVGDAIAVRRAGLLEHVPERGVLVRIDVGGHAGRIMLKPNSIHGDRSCFLSRVYSTGSSRQQRRRPTEYACRMKSECVG